MQGFIMGFDGICDGWSKKRKKDKERGWKGMGGLRWVLLALMTQKGERKLIECKREKRDSE